MKLGTQTNSLTNHLYSHMVKGQPEPEVGMGATLLSWTDRYAATIVKVWRMPKKGTIHLVVRQDHSIRTDNNGLSESQKYEFAPNPRGYGHTFRLGRSGRWEEIAYSEHTKRWHMIKGLGLRIGEREEYRDPTF